MEGRSRSKRTQACNASGERGAWKSDPLWKLTVPVLKGILCSLGTVDSRDLKESYKVDLVEMVSNTCDRNADAIVSALGQN